MGSVTIAPCPSCMTERKLAKEVALLESKEVVWRLLQTARATLQGADVILRLEVVRHEPVPDLREAIAVVQKALASLKVPT